MDEKEFYKSAHHPLQSLEWAEFRKKTGVKVVRGTNFQLTIHKIPNLSWTIGYLPKGPMPDKKMIEELEKIGKKEKCIFIQIEPNVRALTSEEPSSVTSEVAEWTPRRWKSEKLYLKPSFHPLFTRYTFILDLTKSEQELLAGMHPKTRYNIKLAQRHGVKVVEDNSDKAFETYLKLLQETTKRQKFYAHDEKYHGLMWQTLRVKNSKLEYRNSKQIQNTNDKKFKSFEHYNLDHSKIVSDLDRLTAHLLTAKYRGETLVAWVLFTFKDTLYYPYGASSSLHKETMASNLMMWEAINFGKKLGLKRFDMWGSLGPDPDKNDPWYGFHRFKQGYGGELIELLGSFDLVINPLLYHLYKIADKLRWSILKLKNSVQ